MALSNMKQDFDTSHYPPVSQLGVTSASQYTINHPTNNTLTQPVSNNSHPNPTLKSESFLHTNINGETYLVTPLHSSRHPSQPTQNLAQSNASSLRSYSVSNPVSSYSTKTTDNNNNPNNHSHNSNPHNNRNYHTYKPNSKPIPETSSLSTSDECINLIDVDNAHLNGNPKSLLTVKRNAKQNNPITSESWSGANSLTMLGSSSQQVSENAQNKIIFNPRQLQTGIQQPISPRSNESFKESYSEHHQHSSSFQKSYVPIDSNLASMQNSMVVLQNSNYQTRRKDSSNLSQSSSSLSKLQQNLKNSEIGNLACHSVMSPPNLPSKIHVNTSSLNTDSNGQSSHSSNQSSGIGQTSSEGMVKELRDKFMMGDGLHLMNENLPPPPMDLENLKSTENSNLQKNTLIPAPAQTQPPPPPPKKVSKRKDVTPMKNNLTDSSIKIFKSPEQYIGETNRANQGFANVVNKKRSSKFATQV